MGKYTRQAAIVDAFQWNGPTSPAFPQWFTDALTAGTAKVEFDGITVSTDHGALKASRGDWIIKDQHGIVMCKDAIFADDYRPIRDTPQPT
jgi:hypothetical protein